MKQSVKYLHLSGDGRVVITAQDWVNGGNRVHREYKPKMHSRRRVENWANKAQAFVSVYPSTIYVTYRRD
jgi:hypothetical protein